MQEFILPIALALIFSLTGCSSFSSTEVVATSTPYCSISQLRQMGSIQANLSYGTRDSRAIKIYTPGGSICLLKIR